MIVCLDANIVIYNVERNPVWEAVTTPVWQRAAQLRAAFNLKPLDSIYLASAAEYGCGLFLTNDAPLARCTAVSVEILT